MQIILIIFFVHIIDLEIRNTRIEYLDIVLANKIANMIFVSFCLMVLINGSNFIDGLNGLFLKYFLLIYLVILFNFNHIPYVEKDFLINIILILLIILFFNLFGLIYMGDPEHICYQYFLVST